MTHSNLCDVSVVQIKDSLYKLKMYYIVAARTCVLSFKHKRALYIKLSLSVMAKWDLAFSF